ncbi:metal-sensitive transcriptional regulator [bacterium BFN5]|nr:metal-sensitive transcriptional regulator [bacterium BFN5]
MLVDKEKADLRQRLKKVSGQINGIDKMLEEGRYCVDILQQILAARAALNKVAQLILESHGKESLDFWEYLDFLVSSTMYTKQF